MAHKDRKKHKHRGNRNQGYGSPHKHRGAGSRGGRGMAGSKKHKWTKISKEHPDYFGKKGFKRPQSVVRKNQVSTINVGELSNSLMKLQEQGEIEKKDEVYEIDLNDLGYDKLLGAGKAKFPMKIKADEYSSKAKDKIEEAGGSIQET